MKKREGMHFYINISNFDDIVEKEELDSGNVNHSIHALNTFFSSIEWFGNNKYTDVFVTEKVTGSRIHMYILADVQESFKIVKDVSMYAYRLSLYLNNDVTKYKKLKCFNIKVGACYGRFYDFVFRDNDYEEETTIGFAANYAAKLQMLSGDGFISIDSSIYDVLDVADSEIFKRINSSQISKYKEFRYYTAPIRLLTMDDEDYREELNHAYEIVQKTNLADMNNESAREMISPDRLSVKTIKKVIGIPLFADVRGFTQQFDKDDANLEEMADKTQKILKSLYSAVKGKGVHIQFQGDREFALFHDIKSQNCAQDSIITAMRIIDKVKEFNVNIGVGESIGTVFASRIGARNSKDNILIGRTVSDADRFEDDYAGENQLVISQKIFCIIEDENPILANQFEKLPNGCYMTQTGYKEFCEIVEDDNLERNNKTKNYNAAWAES